MNYKFFAYSASALAMFTTLLSGCNGSSSDAALGPQKMSNADMEVQTYSELPSCAEKREGKTAYVADQDQGYICSNGNWAEDDAAVQVINSSTSTLPSNTSGTPDVPQNVFKGSLLDSRDNQTYQTVTIGSQTWMAENLNFKTANSKCYDNDAGNCSRYGSLYTWDDAKGACPSGWHLPTATEYENLFATVGGAGIAGKMLKSKSGWSDNGNGTDAFGINALAAGWGDGKGYYNTASRACFWSSTNFTSCIYNDMDIAILRIVTEEDIYDMYSIRCVEDGTTNSSGAFNSALGKINPSSVITGSITDSRDGQTYKTVKIGTQTWVAQNLNYESANSYCYDDDPANCSKLGRLYNWESAQTACPIGWHLPTIAEWFNLYTAVGGQSTASKMLKSSSGWSDFTGCKGGRSINGTDDYSFSALLAGERYSSGTYRMGSEGGSFWSSTEKNSETMRIAFFRCNDDHASSTNGEKDQGYPVRCIQN